MAGLTLRLGCDSPRDSHSHVYTWAWMARRRAPRVPVCSRFTRLGLRNSTASRLGAKDPSREHSRRPKHVVFEDPGSEATVPFPPHCRGQSSHKSAQTQEEETQTHILQWEECQKLVTSFQMAATFFTVECSIK